jgi:hypothetical protein
MSKETKTVLEKVLPQDNGCVMYVFDKVSSNLEGVSFNTTAIPFGNTTYRAMNIYFYNKDGVVFNNYTSYLRKRYGTECYGLHFPNLKKIKRYKEPQFDSSDVYFVPTGKDSYWGNKADLYIPVAYLENRGYEIVLKESGNTPEALSYWSETLLETTAFDIAIKSGTEYNVDNIKTNLCMDVMACENETELKAVLIRYARELGVYIR